MDFAVVLINIIFSLILLTTGIVTLKKHSRYPDCSTGYHMKAAMQDEKSWDNANRYAGITSIIEGIVFFLVIPILSYIWTDITLLWIWLGLAVIAVLLALFLPVLLLHFKGGRS